MSPWLQELVQPRSHFCSSQQADFVQLKAFVDGQRLKRRKVRQIVSCQAAVATHTWGLVSDAFLLQGAAGSGAKLDETAFEAARAQWGRATISARGMVGAGGDHKSEAWLG